MTRFPGVAKRLADRMRDLGYTTKAGRPDVGRFCRDYGYDPRAAYPWVNKNRLPSFEHLQRLAVTLNTSASWLLFGEAEREDRLPSARQALRRLAFLEARAKTLLSQLEREVAEMARLRRALQRAAAAK